MTQNPRKKTSKWQSVEKAIRERIVAGEYKRGDNLPTYGELEDIFGVSRITMQQVVTHLKRDGFITSIERQGLFVSKTPPHLSRIGILIPREEHEVRYWKEMVQCARVAAAMLGQELVVYRNLFVSAACEKQVRHDLDNRLLAGLVFLHAIPPNQYGHSLMLDPSVPKAVSLAPAEEEYMASYAVNTMRILLDDDTLSRQALDYLCRQRGCGRIALFANLGASTVTMGFDREAERLGVYAPDAWRFPIALESVELAEKIVALLLRQPAGERPDGIFVSDDNLAARVVKGIAATHLRIPEDIAVIVHYNRSVDAPNPLPVKSLGYDLKGLMLRTFASFAAFRETGRLPERLEEAPLFDHESLQTVTGKDLFYENAI